MPVAQVNDIDISYDVTGDGVPLLLLTGLGGVGRSWGDQIGRFAAAYRTIVPDHRGAGGSSQPDDGYTIAQHASDMAELLRTLGTGPAHIVGSSTGGAIAQVMALDHADVVRSISLVASWARPDDYFRHQFGVRRSILDSLGVAAYAEAAALFLFSAGFFRDHYPQVVAWMESTIEATRRPDILAKRINMIVAFDESRRLSDIDVPALVVAGAADACTPPYLSRELATLIPHAELVVLDGGHLIAAEQPDAFHATIREFVDQH